MQYIRFCLRTFTARTLMASRAGPGLVFLICSLYLLSAASSLLILSSTVSLRLLLCAHIHAHTQQRTCNKNRFAQRSEHGGRQTL